MCVPRSSVADLLCNSRYARMELHSTRQTLRAIWHIGGTWHCRLQLCDCALLIEMVTVSHSLKPFSSNRDRQAKERELHITQRYLEIT